MKKRRTKMKRKKTKIRFPISAGKPGGPMKSKKRRLLEKASKEEA